MADWGQPEPIEAEAEVYQLDALPERKLFNKWPLIDVQVSDISLSVCHFIFILS